VLCVKVVRWAVSVQGLSSGFLDTVFGYCVYVCPALAGCVHVGCLLYSGSACLEGVINIKEEKLRKR
jgi:hypothetical protein